MLEETELDLRLKTTLSSAGLFLALFLFLITKGLRCVLSGELLRLPVRIRQSRPERVPVFTDGLGLGLGLGGLIPLFDLVNVMSSSSVLATNASKAARKAWHFLMILLGCPFGFSRSQYRSRSKPNRIRAWWLSELLFCLCSNVEEVVVLGGCVTGVL